MKFGYILEKIGSLINSNHKNKLTNKKWKGIQLFKKKQKQKQKRKQNTKQNKKKHFFFFIATCHSVEEEKISCAI